jgi:hypothetical protein
MGPQPTQRIPHIIRFVAQKKKNTSPEPHRPQTTNPITNVCIERRRRCHVQRVVEPAARIEIN